MTGVVGFACATATCPVQLHGGRAGEQVSDRLEGQERTEGDDDEEHELFDRHPERELDPDHVATIEPPVPAGDRQRVLQVEDRHDGQQGSGEPTWAPADAGPEEGLEGDGEGHTQAHEEEVLEAVHRLTLTASSNGGAITRNISADFSAKSGDTLPSAEQEPS